MIASRRIRKTRPVLCSARKREIKQDNLSTPHYRVFTHSQQKCPYLTSISNQHETVLTPLSPHPSHSAHPLVVKRKALMLITLLLYDFCAFRCVCRANVGVDRRHSPPYRLLGGGAGHAAPHFQQSRLEH